MLYHFFLFYVNCVGFGWWFECRLCVLCVLVVMVGV